jgi:hypothetical protein
VRDSRAVREPETDYQARLPVALLSSPAAPSPHEQTGSPLILDRCPRSRKRCFRVARNGSLPVTTRRPSHSLHARRSLITPRGSGCGHHSFKLERGTGALFCPPAAPPGAASLQHRSIAGIRGAGDPGSIPGERSARLRRALAHRRPGGRRSPLGIPFPQMHHAVP